MSEDANIQIGVALDVDEKSFAQGDKALEKIAKDASLKKATKAAARYAKETGDLAAAQKMLAKALKQRGDVTENESKKTVQAIEREIKALERLEAQQREADSAGGKFDKARKDVELAGDFESQIRTVGGAADVAGLGGVGKVAGGLGEIGALTEALPLLKASAAGLPDAARAAATALGPGGLALGGV
ncbi:unnamed protein product, partial [marine sediment metagenome]